MYAINFFFGIQVYIYIKMEDLYILRHFIRQVLFLRVIPLKTSN